MKKTKMKIMSLLLSMVLFLFVPFLNLQAAADHPARLVDQAELLTAEEQQQMQSSSVATTTTTTDITDTNAFTGNANVTVGNILQSAIKSSAFTGNEDKTTGLISDTTTTVPVTITPTPVLISDKIDLSKENVAVFKAN